MQLALTVVVIASVGLGVSGSQDLGGIAGIFIDMRHAHMRIGRLALSESHKWLHLTPVDGSSVNFFSFEANALFPPSHAS